MYWARHVVERPGNSRSSIINHVSALILLPWIYLGAAVPTDAAVIAWGRDNYSQATVPAGLEEAVAVAGGGWHNVVLKRDGTAAAWGYNVNGQADVPSDLSNVTAIAAGPYHSMALRSDGAIVTWGHPSARPPPWVSKVVAIAAGATHCLALREDGTVAAWGFVDNYGQTNVPPNATNVVAISARENSNLALKGDGTVVYWGQPGYGLPNLPFDLTNILAVACGVYHALALKSDGTVVAWGHNAYGRTNVPAGLTDVVAVAAGETHSLALKRDGTVVAWGNSEYGLTNVPPDLPSAVGIDAGWTHNLVLVGEGVPFLIAPPFDRTVAAGETLRLRVEASGAFPLSYQWLYNGDALAGATNSVLTVPNAQASLSGGYSVVVSNALGVVTSREIVIEVLAQAPMIMAQPARAVVSPGAGTEFCVTAIGSEPLRYQWQFNGADLSGATNSCLALTHVEPIHNGSYRVIVGNDYGLATSSDAILSVRNVVAWGRNSGGQTMVPEDLTNAVAISGGYDHSLALKADGTVVAWGTNSYGQSSVPAGLSNAVAIAAGRDHSMALRADGTVAVWGRNNFGQVNVPANLTNAVAISSGYDFAMALRADRTVTVWGRNDAGQTAVPAGLANVVAIAGGGYHCLALRDDGRVVAWGSNNFGAATVPPGLNYVAAIAGGGEHSLAMTMTGTLIGWGYNSIGQANPPPDLTGGSGISGGRYFSLGLYEDGTVVGWGFPYDGATSIPAAVTNAVAISAGGWHGLALLGDGKSVITVQPVSRTLFSGSDYSLYVRAVGKPPLSYKWEHNDSDWAGGGYSAVTLLGVQTSDSGTWRVRVSNSLGTATSAVATLTVKLSLADALDTTDLSWSTGAMPWIGQTNLSHDRVDAAQSGAISHNQQSILQTTVTGPGTLRFWWKVSSEAGNDTLKLQVGASVLASISGEVDWRQETVYLTAGTKQPRWIYSKNAGVNGGLDAGWVDQVSYAPGGTVPIILSQPVSLSVLAGESTVFSVTAGGTPPFSYQWQKNETDIPNATNLLLLLNNLYRRDSGVFAVVVTNAYGSALSSNATLTVRTPQRLTLLPPSPGGSFGLLFGDADGSPLLPGDVANFEVRASTNLVDWLTLPHELTLTNGSLLLEDPERTNFPVRFYRVIEK